MKIFSLKVLNSQLTSRIEASKEIDQFEMNPFQLPCKRWVQSSRDCNQHVESTLSIGEVD